MFHSRKYGVQVYKSLPAVAHFSGVKFDEEDGEVSTHRNNSKSNNNTACIPLLWFTVLGGNCVNS